MIDWKSSQVRHITEDFVSNATSLDKNTVKARVKWNLLSTDYDRHLEKIIFLSKITFYISFSFKILSSIPYKNHLILKKKDVRPPYNTDSYLLLCY